jgi:hypothetical protein
MELSGIPFAITDCSQIPVPEHQGESGTALWRTCDLGCARVRMVEYSPGYLADHWCDRGHILLVLEGSLTTELANGDVVTMTPGCGYHVGHSTQAHRSRTKDGARLFIVD